MSLRLRVLLLLSGLVGVYAIAQFAIQHLLVAPKFQELEDEEARANLGRVVSALENETEHLDGLVNDWSAWDDTYAYAAAPNAAYEQGNLQDATLENNRLSIIYAVDTAGTVRIRRTRGIDVPLAAFPPDTRALGDGLLDFAAGESRHAGFLLTEAGPMIVSARPILRSDESGPPAGTLLMGRLVDAERIAEIVKQTRVHAVVASLEPPGTRTTNELPFGLTAAHLQEVLGSEAGMLRLRDADYIEALTVVKDIHRHPALIVRADMPRAISAKGRASLDFATGTTLGAVLLILFALLLVLQRAVVGPLTELTERTIHIRRDGGLNHRIGSKRTDEIGVLSGEIDRMVDDLARSREELVQTARKAGMSEVAAGVLHDVGNALSSVGVAASETRRRADELPIADLLRIAEDMRSKGDDLPRFLAEDPRGRRYPEFLMLVADELERERAALARETIEIVDGLAHVDALVRAQTDLASEREVEAFVRPAAKLDWAASIARVERDGVGIVREYDDLAPFAVERHRLLSILVNLVKNAREAIDAAGREKGTITLRVALAAADRVRFEVEDDGVGMDASEEQRLFQHGFTTKPAGHGFGLHAAANSAHAMGGSLTARSRGKGRGATFVLELPYAPVLESELEEVVA